MPDQTVVNVVKKTMSGWDGTFPDNKGNANRPAFKRNRRPASPATIYLVDWALNMVEWGKAVRRDILVLEHHVAQLKPGVNPADLFYGDPGDPPPVTDPY